MFAVLPVEETNATVIPEDKGVEEGKYLHQIPPDHVGPKTSPKARRKKRTGGVKWTEADYELARDEKHRLKAVMLRAMGEKFTPRPMTIRDPNKVSDPYSFIFNDVGICSIECLHYMEGGVLSSESGYDTDEHPGDHLASLQEQVWLSLKRGNAHQAKTDEAHSPTEILADLADGQEIGSEKNRESDLSGDDHDEPEDYDNARGPTPRQVVQMNSLEPRPTQDIFLMDAGKRGQTPAEEILRLAPPLLFNGSLDGNACVFLFDPGAGTSVMNPKYADKFGVEQVRSKSPIRLRYGNGGSQATMLETRRSTMAIGENRFQGTFYINPEPFEVADVILGMDFIVRERAEMRFPSDESNRQPFVCFPDKKQIYPSTDLLGGTLIDCCLLSATEAVQYLKQEERKNGSLVDVESFVVSVTKEMQLNGDIEAQEATMKPVHRDVEKLMNKYDIFRSEVPMHEIADRELNLKHSIPMKEGEGAVRLRPHPISGPKLEVLQALIKNLLKAGVIEKGNLASEWGAPVLLLRKGGTRPGLTNSWRVVCDFRALNEKSQKLQWSPPDVREILDSLKGCKYFSKTDAVGGFYQLSLDEKDRDKTTFRIKNAAGHMEAYRFKVASLGLQGAPHSFQIFMEKVCEGLHGTFVYLDDVVIASKSWAEHLVRLEAYFKRCAQNKVFLHPLKCEFGVQEIEYLGLKVSHNRIQVSDDKMAAVKAYAPPDSYPALHRFLGFMQYLSSFVRDFATKTAPLSDLLKGGAKKKKFTWTAGCQSAFEQVRDDLIKAVGLGIPDKNADLVVETDASGVGIGAVLYQYAGGNLTPLWFLSKKLNKAEKNYSSRDREALAVVYALKKFSRYLHLKPFVLYSDHESLIYLRTQKDLKTSRDHRWAECLGEFLFEQRYKKGELMVVPDALSRAFDDRAAEKGVWAELEHTGVTEIEPQCGVLNAKDVQTTPIHSAFASLDKAPDGINITNTVHDLLKEDVTTYDPKTRVSKKALQERELREAYIMASTVTKVFGGLSDVLPKAYADDPNFKKIYELSQQSRDSLSEKEKTLCRNFTVVDNILMYTPVGKETRQPRICIPFTEGNGMRLTVFYEAHESVLHGGIEKTYMRVANTYWWPGLYRDCANYVKSCKECRRFASAQKRPEGASESHEIPGNRWDVICADWITDLPVTDQGHDAILAVHDKITKYAYLIPASKSDTAERTAERLFAHVFSQHGLPRSVVSDRDKLFTARFFAQLMRIVGVRQAMSTSFAHNYNGASERLNRTIEVMLRHVVGDFPERDFDAYLPLVQWAYNTSPHCALGGKTPHFALYGTEPRQPLEQPGLADRDLEPGEHQALKGFVEHQQTVLLQARDALVKAQMTMDERANKSYREPESLEVGDKVYLSTRNLGLTHLKHSSGKLQERFIGPYSILERISRYTYKLQLPKNMSRLHPVFPVSLLWKSTERLPTLSEQLPVANTAPDNGRQSEPTASGSGEDSNQPTVSGTSQPADKDAAGDWLRDDDNNQLYEVDKILDRRQRGRSKGYEYFVSWKGCEAVENCWIPAKNFEGNDAKAMRKAFDNTCS